LRGACGVGGAAGVAARKDENLALRIDGDTRGFAKVDVWRKLQEVGDGMETDFGRLLSEKRNSHEKEQSKNRAFHARQPREFKSSSRIIRGFGESVAC